MKSSSHVNRAKWWQLLGFSGNNAATNAHFLMISLYFLIYSTEVYGVSPLVVGMIMTGTRLFDAFTDPLIGLLIDKTNTKFGRFRPWILGGGLFSASMFYLMFSGIQFGGTTANIIGLVTLYSLWVLGYTAQTACTKSAQTILTSIPTQRTLVNAMGTLNTMVVYLFAMAIIYPKIILANGIEHASTWQSAASIIVIIQVILTFLVVIGIWDKDNEKHLPKVETSKLPKLKDYIDIFKHNRALQMLIVAASTNKITQTMQGGLTVVFYFYVVKNPQLQSVVPMATLPVTIISTFLYVYLISKFGRKEIFTFSSWAGMLMGIAAVFLININPASSILLIAVMAGNGLLIAGAGDINIISMIADSADYERYKNGRFVPGMIGTSFSLIDKVISSFGSMISASILTGLGFVSISETAPTSKLYWGVLVMYFVFPAIGHFFSIIGMKFYPLDKKTHEKMIVELAERDYASHNHNDNNKNSGLLGKEMELQTQLK